MIHLHDRWLKDCGFYRDLYEQIEDVSLMPRIDWGPVFEQKQVSTVIILSEHLVKYPVLFSELSVKDEDSGVL